MWRWIKRIENQRLLTLLASALAAIAVAAWTVFTYFDRPEHAGSKPAVSAGGGVAAGRDIHGSTIIVDQATGGERSAK